MNQADRALLQKMATPTRLGVTIGKDYMGAEYVPYPWMLYAERRILAAINRPGRSFVILNVPPQSGKTTTFGMLLAAWYLGMNPFHQVLFIAYAEDYAASWGLKTRDLLQRYGPELFQERVSSQQDAKSDWKMANGFGGMKSVGITGGITGNPGHLILIDDVIKTMEDAMSPAALEKHFAEYEGSITTRFQENTTVLVTATRWTEADLSGRLIDRQNEPGYTGDRFEVISIPAIAELPEELEAPEPNEDGTMPEEDPEVVAEREAWRDELGRKPGECLKSRFSESFYISRRASLTPFIWSALYQQNPSVREGGMFPRGKWRYWLQGDPTRPRFARFVRAWDLATTEGGGDWTVGTKMAIATNGDLYIIERKRFRKSSGDVEAEVVATAKADGFQVKIIIEQERAGAGVTVVDHYKRKLGGYMVEGARAEGTKEQRATPYSIMQNQERVWLPGDDKILCKEWIDEHKKMMGDGRRPRHDDQIDTGAYAALDLLGNAGSDMFIPGYDQIPGGEPGDEGALNDDRLLAIVGGNNPFFG